MGCQLRAILLTEASRPRPAVGPLRDTGRPILRIEERELGNGDRQGPPSAASICPLESVRPVEPASVDRAGIRRIKRESNHVTLARRIDGSPAATAVCRLEAERLNAGTTTRPSAPSSSAMNRSFTSATASGSRWSGRTTPAARRRPRCKDRPPPLRRESHRPQESAHGCFALCTGGDLDPQEHGLSAHVEEDLLPTGQKIRKRRDAL